MPRYYCEVCNQELYGIRCKRCGHDQADDHCCCKACIKATELQKFWTKLYRSTVDFIRFLFNM